MRHPRCAAPRTKECFLVSARRGMFRLYCARGEFLTLIYRQLMARIVAVSEACPYGQKLNSWESHKVKIVSH